jgi:dolichyl-phosphate beta-glucosyltransferase
MKKLSVVIPAYNEAERIGSTLTSIHNFLIKQTYPYEIIVVNDGSRDNTAGLVSGMAATIKNLKLIDNKHNQGKGGVVKDGMLAATGDIRLFMDADNSTKVDEITKFLPYFEKGYDIVIGSRRIKGSNIVVHQGLWRDFLGGVFRLIVHTLVPVGVTDSQCGFKAFSAKAAQEVFPKQRIFRWAFDVEILAIARKMGFKIQEAPITWVNDGQSKVKLSGEINMLIELLKTRLNLWTGKYQ